MKEIQFKSRTKHTKLWCPFGSKQDIEGKRFKMNDCGEIEVKNQYGIYHVDVDMRDVKRR